MQNTWILFPSRPLSYWVTLEKSCASSGLSSPMDGRNVILLTSKHTGELEAYQYVCWLNGPFQFNCGGGQVSQTGVALAVVGLIDWVEGLHGHSGARWCDLG